MNSISLKSYGKINLFLHILGKRSDGFHELFTLFSKIGLHDNLAISLSDKQEIVCSKPDIPTDESNIINRVQKILEDDYGVSQKFRIELDKQIPDGGGLGGGSGNAAVYLNGACKLLGIDMDMQTKTDIMASVGSDTAFFLHDKPMVGRGRGEILTPYGDLPECKILLVNPDIHVSTAAVFSSPNLKLTDMSEVNRMRHASAYEEFQDILFNGLEAAVFAEYPVVKEARDALVSSGADFAMMSGSGATVFGIFRDDDSLDKAIETMKVDRPDWKYYKTYLVMG